MVVESSLPRRGRTDVLPRVSASLRRVPGFELTAIPFLYTEDPDSSVIETVEEMADDEEDHELLHDTYDLLPIEEMSVDDHDPVEIDSDSGFAVLRRTIAIRATEGGSGYWMGLMPRTGPSLLVWGARSASGELSMDPALLVEGRSLLPEARGGDYTLKGLDDAQRELFSISFEMDEPADAEEGTGIFVFLLPVERGWEALASLVLAGPGDALVTLDADTEATMALIRDARSGQVRAIRGDFAERPPAPPGHVVRWSRGVPDRDAWRVMTGGRAGAGP